MVDKALFVGSDGAKQLMRELEVITNNLSNVTKTGFRADFQSKALWSPTGSTDDTRTYSVLTRTYSDFTTGPIMKTDRDLDVALSGKGFIAIQGKGGLEGYTRDGSFQLKDGLLKTQSNEVVLGTSGVISIPNAAERLTIGPDGSIIVKIKGNKELVTINKIKLADPDIKKLSKGEDGIFYLANGETAKPDKSIRVSPGSLEGSNVNPVETLTSLIALSREFELQSNMQKQIQQNSSKANELLSLTR
jgi:flagellar basal-body rod protein FlgF